MASVRTNFRTHKGRAVYPWLNQPDTKFHKPDGVYKCGLRVPSDQAKEIVDAANALAKEALGSKADSGARMPYEVDEETGEVVLKTKSKYKPKFHDSKGNVIPDHQVPAMYGGSVLKLKGTMTGYDTGSNWGVTMNLTAVQIIDPISHPSDAEAFDAEDSGFVISQDDASDAAFDADF